MEVYALTAKGKATLAEMRQSPSLAKTSSYQVLNYLSRSGTARIGQIADGTGLSIGEVTSKLGELKTGGLITIAAKV